VLDVAERLPELAGLVKASVGGAIQVECRVEGEVPRIRADPAEFELALINLAVNARDAMPGGGTLHLRARRTELDGGGAAALVEVQDTGTGMSPQTLQRVFEPFFTTKAVGHGTGLGLSQVYGLVQQAGGQVTIESTPGQGTVVRMVLPAADVPRGPVPTTGPAPLETSATTPNRSAHVLLVEDNEGLARPTAELLENAGHRVTLAACGDDAIERLREAVFDVVISDVRMPGRHDGVALARWIREAMPRLPIVLMTGYTAELDQAQALGVPVLAKPATAQALLKVVAEAVGEDAT
jgi:CheY-like chemotaxis protein